MKHILPFTFALILMIFSCTPDEKFTTSSDSKLSFSLDTLTFDTVFTERGSATRILKLYNTNDKSIIIEKIKVGRGSDSKFRLNVDGLPGNETENIKIAGNDSLYIFAEVTVDPDQPISASPFVIYDDIQFLTNGNEQSVVLEAWGQNANYLPNRFGKGGISGLQCNGGEIVLDDPKPYVIFGIWVVDDCTMTIPAGAKIYVHGALESFLDSTNLKQFYNDGRIIVTASGTLNILGTPENPVILQGDRLEEDFDDVPGQWFGIILSAGSRNNRIEYATIKNSILGVAVDSAAELRTIYSQFYNTTSNGILGIHANILAENCLIYNNASTGVRLTYGGNYIFRNSTLASYGVDASVLSLSNIVCLDFPSCQDILLNDLSVSFTNCIIAGSRKDEITLIESEDRAFDYSFDHCAVKIEEILEEDQYPNFLEDCDNCVLINRDDALFFDIDLDDYHLDTLSIVEEKGILINGFELDLDGVMRDTENPDIGCFEYVYE